MEFKEIIYEKSDRVAVVSYNRPERLNAWTMRMGAEARTAMLDADADPAIGAIILTGAGRAFCAGADMENLNSLAQGNTDQLAGVGRPLAGTEDLDPNFRGRFSWMMALKKPVIGAINGAAVGMGFANSLYCDLRVASDKARMGLIFTQRGLAIEFGASWMLPRIVGIANAMDLAVTGRLIDAAEGRQMGLINKVVADAELMPAARALASQIATQCTPLGVSKVKRLIYGHLFTDLATATTDDDQAAVEMLHSEDFKEGIKAYMEKRTPRFTGK
ncbi:MAG TPA: enoyl-CoA hydratase-related protein [Candidatus Binataceae bacterium]|nr:enoyl-CoA hydratase-related protein [Candidatus Binataceae bacterium]